MGICRSSNAKASAMQSSSTVARVNLVVQAALTGEKVDAVSLLATDPVQLLIEATRCAHGGGIKLFHDGAALQAHMTLSDAGLFDGAVVSAIYGPAVEIYAMQVAALLRGVPMLNHRLPRIRWRLSAFLGIIEKQGELKEHLITHLDRQGDQVRKMVFQRLRLHIDMFFQRALVVPDFTLPDHPLLSDTDVMKLWTHTEDVSQMLAVVSEIFWLRLGSPIFRRREGGEELPQMPADILGRLAPEYSSLFFYYKDADPSIWGGGGVVHRGYCFYVCQTLWQLVESLSRQDRAAFLRLDTCWTKESMNVHDSLDKCCTCEMCIYCRFNEARQGR